MRRLNVDGCDLEQISLPAYALQRRRDPRGRGRRRGRRAHRRLLHRLRGRRLADMMGKRCHDRHAGAAHARTWASVPRGTVRPGALGIARGTVHRGDELERFEGDGGAEAGGRVAKVITRGGLELPADAVVIGAGVTPDVELAQRAGLRSASAGACAARRVWRARCRGCSRRGTSASTSPCCTAARRFASSTGMSPSTTARRSRSTCSAATWRTRPCPYFYSVLADWGELEYVGPAYEWDQEIVRGSFEDGDLHQLVSARRRRVEAGAHVRARPTTSTHRLIVRVLLAEARGAALAIETSALTRERSGVVARQGGEPASAVRCEGIAPRGVASRSHGRWSKGSR